MRDVIRIHFFAVLLISLLCGCGARQHPGGIQGNQLQEAGCQYLKECPSDGKTAYDCVKHECQVCDVMPDKPKCIVVVPRIGARLVWCCPSDIDYSTVMSGDAFERFHGCGKEKKGSGTVGESPEVTLSY